MANNIVTTSFYSKVENNTHRMSAEDLFSILQAHQIDITEFTNHLTANNNNLFEQLKNQVTLAYYSNDTYTIKNILNQVDNHTQLEHTQKKIIKLLAKLSMNALSPGITILTPEDEMNIKQLIFQLDEWDPYKLALYANSLDLYAIEDNHAIIASIFAQSTHTQSDKKIGAIIIIVLNFIIQCINHDEEILANYYIKQLELIPFDPQSHLFHKLMYAFLKNYLTYQQNYDQSSMDNMKAIIVTFRLSDSHIVAQQLQDTLQKLINPTNI